MANSPKYREFFITINKDATCYERALEIAKELNYKLYALIVHDKDKLINENGEVQQDKNGNDLIKPTHKHLMVELKNPISFNSMQNKFQGAHIDIPKYKKSAYQYLVHNSPNSKGVKYRYDTNEIISNDLNAVKYIIETETSELFQQNRFLTYIAEGTRTPYQFVKRFGLDAYRQYWKPYSEMLSQLDTDEEMQRDLKKIIVDMQNDLPF